MNKKFQLYIQNTQTGPFKIPFKRGTPKELQAKVNGIIMVGKKAIIPSDLSQHVDLEMVERDAKRGHVKYRVKEVLDIPSKVKPIKKRKVGRPRNEEPKIEKKKEKGVS